LFHYAVFDVQPDAPERRVCRGYSFFCNVYNRSGSGSRECGAWSGLFLQHLSRGTGKRPGSRQPPSLSNEQLERPGWSGDLCILLHSTDRRRCGGRLRFFRADARIDVLDGRLERWRNGSFGRYSCIPGPVGHGWSRIAGHGRSRKECPPDDTVYRDRPGYSYDSGILRGRESC